MNALARYFFFCIVSLFFASCANQVAPQGGEKDVKPPTVLKSVPENFSTGFHSKKIQLTFDEYIQLKDLNSQLIVSPPLSKMPEPKIRQKTLTVELNDTLSPNTTYTLNFGNSILDNNEGNSLEDFHYVFSTGSIIDSLTISGNIENAFDKKTEKGILVMLYKEDVDSLPFKKRPDYFTKTNDKGLFRVTNIAPASYKIFALKESNADYLFNAPDEKIAFLDELVQADSKNTRLRLFAEKSKQRILKGYSEEPGKAVVIFAQPAPDMKVRFISDSLKSDLAFVEESKNRDTVLFWYKNMNLDSLVLFFSDGKSVHDTVSIRLFKNEGKTFSKKKSVLGIGTNFKNGEAFDLNKNLILQFSHPVVKADFLKINLIEDSVPLTNLVVTFNDTLKKGATIRYPWKEKATYRLFIPPGAFTDIFGLNNDTLMTSFKVRSLAEYGTLAIKLKLPFKGVQYIVQLIDDKETIFRSSVITSDTTLNYDFLHPNSYRLKIIEDINVNAVWDAGNYLQRIQPEKTGYYPENITVRANWDVDVNWKPEVE